MFLRRSLPQCRIITRLSSFENHPHPPWKARKLKHPHSVNPWDAMTPWRPPKVVADQARRTQRNLKKVKRILVPEEFKKYNEEFDKVVEFETQLKSLSKRGFLRTYRAYDPPSDLDQRFIKIAAQILGESQMIKAGQMDQIGLGDDLSVKGKLLLALEEEFGHAVPNSMIYSMATLDKLFLFYSTKVDVRTPYDKLHEDQLKGDLPPNLHVQLDPLRFPDTFDPESKNPLEAVTAFPRSRTVLVSPEARKKYGNDFEVETTETFWKNSRSDPDKWFDE